MTESTVPEIMTAAEVADMLHVCVETVYRLARKNEIPCVHVGTKVLFSREKILSWANCEM